MTLPVCVRPLRKKLSFFLGGGGGGGGGRLTHSPLGHHPN